MNIEIGTRIKTLRLSNSLTQEQLAQKLGVSAQAVSKWESGTNMPDIQMLPDLAVIFGVSIDELFAMTEESRMERIENQMENVRFLSSEEFRRSEQFLKDCREKPDCAARATLLLAQLYNKRADEYHQLAKPIARKALQLNPTVKAAHNAIFDAERGPYGDWNFTNHWEQINFYKEIVKQHPEDIHNYFWLLDLLIADHRLAEARDYAERMKQTEYTYHYEMYMGYICKEDCDLDSAFAWWQKMTEHSPEKGIVWEVYGDIMAKLCRYDEAVEYYKKAMPMRQKPRFIDCEEAVAQICMIRGDLEGALEMQKQKLRITREDWTTEGETVDEVQREIRKLEAMLSERESAK